MFAYVTLNELIRPGPVQQPLNPLYDYLMPQGKVFYS
jgi:hypothetical protein